MKEIEALRQKAATIEALITDERNAELRNLPGEYRFSDVESFIAAVRNAVGGGVRRGRRSTQSETAAELAGERRRRARISDETRAQVKKMAQEGKTGAEIAKALGISLPSVQNIKKAAGLVKKRK